MSIGGVEAERELDEHLAAVADGVGVPHTRSVGKTSWLGFALNPFPDLFAIGPGGTSASIARIKVKDALLRRRHTDRQLAVMYDHLTRPDVTVGGGIGFATYGGRVNTVPSDATAATARRRPRHVVSRRLDERGGRGAQSRVAPRILPRRVRRNGRRAGA